ncbi:chromatin assembly factor 1 subunit B [Diachasma alloeum]|uniref:chromatin assembly factor 1 subunit B n=1 Tax=Diachasma alloeum TaxID=454923 RepID=UPI0007383FDF|nr:chromatin assembly factor 1 subunit B [Diachasma alloeum]
MKCTIPEISWHNRDPVLSIDIQTAQKKPQSPEEEPFWRLATGGADTHVLIWHLRVNELGAASVSCVTDLDRHQKAVNVVRFSPSGEVLATGDDESAIILWRQKEDSATTAELPSSDDGNFQNKEQWAVWKVLRGHLEDIYDISWSPDSSFMVSGSVDNSAIVWDVQKGRSISILQDYKGFVQGVSWDPLNQFISTLSTDRHCRLIDIKAMKTVQRVHKAVIPTPPGHPLEGQTVRLFHDDTFKSFFRRLTFTVDGSLIVAPSGIIEPQDSSQRASNATVVFSRHSLKEPILILPSMDESTIAVRCCPVYFQLREEGPAALFALPYRMIFAVATQKSVLIYDTQQIAPVAVVSNIHYTRLTDVAWSSDGRLLVVSSTDGYCSIIHFQEGELGKIYTGDKTIPMRPPVPLQKSTDIKLTSKGPSKGEPEKILAEFDTDAMDIDITEKISSSQKPEETVIKDNEAPPVSEETEDIKLVFEPNTCDVPPAEESGKVTPPKAEAGESATKNTPPKADVISVLSSRTPRRVKLITLSSPKRPKEDL